MPPSQPNLPIGDAGLIAVDKVGNQLLFLDPATFETVHILNGFPTRVHERTTLESSHLRL